MNAVDLAVSCGVIEFIGEIMTLSNNFPLIILLVNEDTTNRNFIFFKGFFCLF